jgi:O-antigen ligase
LLLAVIANLVATYSRTSYVAFAVGLVAIVVLGRRWLLLVIIAGAIAFAPLVPGIGDRLADLGEGTTVRGTPGNSLAWRVDYWGEVIDAGEGRRVTGLGLGVASDSTAQGREPHNDLVRTYVELGGIGLAAYLGFLLAMGWQVRRSLVRTRPATGPPGLPRALAEGYAGILAAYLVGSLTGNLMTQLALLWYVLAVAAAAGLAARRSREQADGPGRWVPGPAHG